MRNRGRDDLPGDRWVTGRLVRSSYASGATCLGGEPNPRKEQILHRPQGGWTTWTRRWSNSLEPPAAAQQCAASNGGGHDDIGTAPEGAAAGSEVPSHSANVRVDAHRFPRVSASCGCQRLLLGSASCRARSVAGLCALSALRCPGARAPGSAARPGNGSRCSSALVASRRCSPGQPGEEPSAAPQDLSIGRRMGNRAAPDLPVSRQGWPRGKSRDRPEQCDDSPQPLSSTLHPARWSIRPAGQPVSLVCPARGV